MKLYGAKAAQAVVEANGERFAEYRFDPERYIREKLGWTPWRGGEEGLTGQGEILDAYVLALRQLHERDAWEKGALTEETLEYWTPGQDIQNVLRIEAGHTVGKTKLLNGMVQHFFDCFVPSIIYTYAPSWEQIHDLLWKEIKSDRAGKGLPGRILDLSLHVSDNHFAKGRATNNAGGSGTERVQGQHGKYLMFVLDEAEGVAEFVYDATESMSSGGIAIIVLAANPRTRNSRFHRARSDDNVKNFRISCLDHPNVRAGKEIVPAAVRRQYVVGMLKHCEVVPAHDEDSFTFVLPFAARSKGRDIPEGAICKPNAEFMFRILGVAPKNDTDNTFISVGRYEAACKREPKSDRPERAWMGIDAAGYGLDNGTLYVRHDGRVWREATFSKKDGDQDPHDYFWATRTRALELRKQGVKSLHVRIDAGGGFGLGVHDLLKRDLELLNAYRGKGCEYVLHLVHFGGTPNDEEAYADLATEMYAEAAETLRGVSLVDPPPLLESDLCERTYKWVNSSGVHVKRLLPKEDFRKEQQKKGRPRSPDDGDGFVLCVAPDFLFAPQWEIV